MEGRREEFIKSVEELGRYSEEEALDEAAALKEKVVSGESPNLADAERIVSNAKIHELLEYGNGMEAIRLKYFTEKSLADDFIIGVFAGLRRQIEETDSEEAYNRLSGEWDRIERWRFGQ